MPGSDHLTIYRLYEDALKQCGSMGSVFRIPVARAPVAERMSTSDTTAGLAIHYVRQAIARWEPRVEVVHLDAGRNPDAPETLDIFLRYRVRGSSGRARQPGRGDACGCER